MGRVRLHSRTGAPGRRARHGRDLAVNPYASVNFYWRETLQQITASGRVTSLSSRQSDELFAERPLAAQATTAVSAQGAPLVDGLRALRSW